MHRLAVVLLCALATSGYAQSVSVAPDNVPLRPVINSDPVQPAVAVYELSTGWSEKKKDNISVPLENPSKTDWQVQGVQSTSGIFVVDFPSKVKAGATEAIDVIYEAEGGTDSEVEVLRVKTDQGIKTVHVRIKREAAVSLDVKELKWSVGGAQTPKVVTAKISAAGLKLKKAKATGGGHKADIETVDASTYRIVVTPGSTAKAGQFAVLLEFDQPLPGKSVVIYGNIGE
jgi:hypothetical protein